MNKLNSYEKQANDFMEKTGTTMTAVFLRNGEYFPGDKDKRDIYNITLTRGGRSIDFKFGQSIAHSMYYTDRHVKKFTYDCNGRKMENGWHTGKRYLDMSKLDFVDSRKGQKPTAYDVLASLTKNDVGTFEDFCSNFGYDTDSGRAETIYKAVLEEYKNLKTLFSDKELDLMSEIQ